MNLIFTALYLLTFLSLLIYLLMHVGEYLLKITLGRQEKMKWSQLRSLQLDLGVLIFCLAIFFRIDDLTLIVNIVLAGFAAFICGRIEDKFNIALGKPRRRAFYTRPTHLKLVQTTVSENDHEHPKRSLP